MVTVDLDAVPSSVSLAPNYRGLWALGLKGGRPRGVVKLKRDGSAILGEELQAAFASLPEPAAIMETAQLQDPPRISVVVCTTFQRQDQLARCLESLAALDYPNYEVIVVDNRAHPSPAIDAPGARVVHEARRGLANARNRGLAEAVGDVIAFTDDDAVVEPNWLSAIALHLQCHPEDGGVTGLVMPMELETEAQVAVEDYYGSMGPRSFVPVSHRLRPGRGFGAFAPPIVDAMDDRGSVVRSFLLYAGGSLGAGVNMAFRAAVIREIGGFDAALGAGTPARGGEDLVALIQVIWRGYGLGFEPAAIVHHQHRRETIALKRQVKDCGVGFTALAVALMVDDPRHLGRMLGIAPRAARILASLYVKRLRSRGRASQGKGAADTLNPELARLELLGMLSGPGAYVRGRFQAARRGRTL